MVAGKLRIHREHDAVARDLCDDTCRRDAEAAPIAAHECGLGQGKGLHRQAVDEHVLRLRVEADTPGRRRSYGLRRGRVEKYQAAFEQVLDDAALERFDRPLQLKSGEAG